MPIIVPILIAVVTGAIFFAIQQHNKKKHQMWERWSLARNWLYHPEWNVVTKRFIGGPFGRGHSRRARFGWEGRFNGMPVIGFRYNYTVGSGDDSTTRYQYVMGIRFDGARFPHLRISHQGLFGGGLNFENAAFNDNFTVECNPPRFAYDFLTPRSIEQFLRPHPPFQQIWTSGDHLLMELDPNLPPEAVDDHLQFATQLVRFLPEFLFRECGTQPPRITDDGPGVSREEQRRRIAAMEYQSQRS